MVEDDPLLRESLANYLGLLGHAVTAVGNSLDCYRALGENQFAVLVIDLGLPDQDGSVLVEYARRNTRSAIIVTTARDTLDTRVDSYTAGADLFLGKPVNGRELAAAIVSLADRRGRSAPEPVGAATQTARAVPGVWRLLAGQRALQLPDGNQLELTPREYRLLYLLANGEGEPVPRAVLVESLYGRQDESAQRALETLVRRTRKKIGEPHAGPSLILTHHGFGYVLAVPLGRS
nr:response regulator transcription factor [Thiocystis minor]